MTVNHSIKALEQEERILTDDLDVLNSINARDELKQETIAKLRNVRASIMVLKNNMESVDKYTENGGFFFSKDGGVLITGNLKVSKVNMDKYKWNITSDDKSAVAVIINNQYELLKKAQDKSEEEQNRINDLVDALTSWKALLGEYENTMKKLSEKHKLGEKDVVKRFIESLKAINKEIEKQEYDKS